MNHKEFIEYLKSKKSHWLKIKFYHCTKYVLIQNIEAIYDEYFHDYEYVIEGPSVTLYKENQKWFCLNQKCKVYSSNNYDIYNPIEFKEIYDKNFNRELLCPSEWEGNKEMTRLNEGIKIEKQIITNIQKDIKISKIEVKCNNSFSDYVNIKTQRRNLKCHENNLRNLKRYKKKCNQLFGIGWPSLSKCYDMNCIERTNREKWKYNNRIKDGSKNN